MTYKRAVLEGKGVGQLVFLQAPEHGSWHALLLQSYLCEERRQGEGHSPRDRFCLYPLATRSALTIGFQVHLVFILFFTKLDLFRVGLLGQLCQLLPGCIAPESGSHNASVRASC
jgi:hypothetical protein